MTVPAKHASPGLVFCLCFIAGLCEGYDLQSAGIAAPKFAPVFHLDPTHLGWVFSASTFGLFVGALVGGRLADRAGRRGVLIASMVTFGLFSIGTALASDTAGLLVMRFLTGLGLGGAMPNLIALTAETGRPERAAMRVTILSSAMPFGGFLVGGLSVARPDIDWTSIFWIGGVVPAIVAAFMVFILPESAAFRGDRTRGIRAGINDVLAAEARLTPTLLMWTSAFFTSLALYLLINWLPSLLVEKGFLKTDASKIAMVLTLGGAASGFVFGVLVRLRHRTWLYGLTWLGMILSVVGMAATGHDLLQACIAGFGMGFFLSGGGFLLYALATEVYPSSGRGTGVGFLVAVSRLGAVAGPLLAGTLLTIHRTAAEVMLALVPLISIALISALALAANKPALVRQGTG
ncbi:MFS transporter [Asticcacaulis sp. 201]|uniref:MFS transporter n=1 Tax=Asticcacaulis sp. 201 TaxID=3028787 RepID=UPI002916C3E8|nr:MFS transporter [Asticcacaulis sp. 201]MDV6330822.1 MFS transporter [Asticcacaulis sp. 201]